jgi:hypothetical protein
MKPSHAPRQLHRLPAAALCALALAVQLPAAVFVVDPSSPSWPNPNDVLLDRPGPVSALPGLGIPAASLGLEAQDVVDAISDGRDPVDPELHRGRQKLIFSVRRGSAGAAGTGVEQEMLGDTAPPAGGSPDGHASDLVVWEGTHGQNMLAPPPLGWSLGLQTGDEANTHLRAAGANPGDNVQGYDRGFRDLQVVPGLPPALPVFFSLRAGSPTLAAIGATAGDVLAVGGPFGPVPVVFVDHSSMSLPPAADLDGLNLEVRQDAAGNLVAHHLRFSVTSPTAAFALPDGSVVDSGATVLRHNGVTTTIAQAYDELGLVREDDIDALESAVTTAALDPDGVIFDPIGAPVLVPLPGGDGLHIDNSAVRGLGGVRFGFPPALGASFRVAFDGLPSPDSTLGIIAILIGYLTDPGSQGEPFEAEVPLFGLRRQGDGFAVGTRFPTTIGGEEVRFLAASVISGSDLVQRWVVMPDPGVIDISFGGEHGAGTLDGPLAVECRVTHDTEFEAWALVTEISHPAWATFPASFQVDGRTVQGDRLRLSLIVEGSPDRQVLALRELEAVLRGAGAQERIRDFEVQEFKTRGGLLVDIWEHAALGLARVTPGFAGGVEVLNLGAGGEDGVHVEGPRGVNLGLPGVHVLLDARDDGSLDPEELAALAIDIAAQFDAGKNEVAIKTIGEGLSLSFGSDGAGPEARVRVHVEDQSGGEGGGAGGAGEVVVPPGKIGLFPADAPLARIELELNRLALVFAEEVSFEPAGSAPALHGKRFIIAGSWQRAGDVLLAASVTATGIPSFTVVLVPVLAPIFRRADANDDGTVNLADAMFTLIHLFLGGRAPGCEDAADANDDGTVNIADPLATLGYLFLGSASPPAPGPTACGFDLTVDGLDCGVQSSCP